MANSPNKQLISSFFENFSRGDIDSAFALVSDDARWWVPGTLPFSGTKSKAEYLQVVGSIQSGFPEGLELNVISILEEGDKLAVEVESNGRHVNGRDYRNQYHFLITVKNERISYVKEYMDTLHLYELIQP